MWKIVETILQNNCSSVLFKIRKFLDIQLYLGL